MPGTVVRPQDIELGRGRLYIALRTAAPMTYPGERFVGICTRLALEMSDEVLTKRDMTLPAAPETLEILTGRNLSVLFTFEEHNTENLALWSMGGIPGQISGPSGSAVGEDIPLVQQGHFYQLGGWGALDIQRRTISSFVLTPNASATPYIITTDYTIDLTNGRLYIVPGGGIANNTTVEADYIYAAGSPRDHIYGGGVTSQEVFLHYFSENANGPTKELRLFRVNLRPDGELPFIQETETDAFSFRGKVLADPAMAIGSLNPYYTLDNIEAA